MFPGKVTLKDYLSGLKKIHVMGKGPEVCRTVAEELKKTYSPDARIVNKRKPCDVPAGTLLITAGGVEAGKKSGKAGAFFKIEKNGSSILHSSHACYLYLYFTSLIEDGLMCPASEYMKKRVARYAFQTERPIWDLYFAQAGRTVRKMDPEKYVRQMARSGFTHLEVNSLAFPEGFEPGVEGEVYPRFYTYCPALDQFVDSFLIRGYYPKNYLNANLEKLKRNSALAVKYGLIPSMTCFEPRNVPDDLLEIYPALRGPRIDHPFRSFKPRYSLTLIHPVVQRHYRELLQNLLREVPELGHLSIWTNDSGAGFEFTHSLYVGANGGAYMVKEWSDKNIFAKAAGENVGHFLHLLKEAGSEINEDFRVSIRAEPFGVEREHVFKSFRDGVDLEAAGTLDVGWETRYRHPEYSDCGIGPFTIFNNWFDSREKPEIDKLARRKSRAHIIHSHGPVNNFEPLLGIPAPTLTWEKLKALHETGVKNLSHFGGMAPPDSVRWDLNRELFRKFQLDPGLKLGGVLLDTARKWTEPGEEENLLKAWNLVDEGIRGFMPNPLYFLWGVWYRILIRPLVPDIEKIPENKRAYYESHLLSTHHNPNRFDLRKDVLFDLMTPDVAEKAVKRIDRRALKPIDKAVLLLAKCSDNCKSSIFQDQLDRIRALRSWMMTRRNVASWISNIYGYIEAKNRKTKNACLKRLREMVKSEILNSESILRLWKDSKTDFMAFSADRETTFIYDKNFGRYLRKKIDLMKEYGDAEPRIDHELMWRVGNLKTGK